MADDLINALLRRYGSDPVGNALSLSDVLRDRYGSTTNALASSPHMEAAHNAMSLTPQEQSLYQRHLANLWGAGGVDNPNGSRSTLYQAVVGNGDRYYSIPTVWDGRILPVRDAMDRANAMGWHNFPSYSSPDEADARYEQMHGYMERDTADYLRNRSPFDYFNAMNK